MKYILEQNSDNYELMGGKGAALAKIGKAIDNIPQWFVVTYEGFELQEKCIKEEAKNEIRERLKEFDDDTYFAVRSSAGNEDSKENSFAGQFETFLYVKKENVIDKVNEVYMSAFSERIETYRKENNINEITIPSVIVQKMVNSEKAGVAFGANPINSNVKEVVVSGVFGLGSSLVDGVATPDTYTIVKNKITKNVVKKDLCHRLENGKVIEAEVNDERKNKQVLSDEEILQVKSLTLKASNFFGRFQDIEWSWASWPASRMM